MYLIEKYFIAKKCQPLSEPSVSHSLFAGGEVEILAELPKCDTETEMSECHWKNRAAHLVEAGLPQTFSLKDHSISRAQ